MHISHTNSSFEVEECLLGAGADVNAKDYLGRTALHYCFVKRRLWSDSRYVEDDVLMNC
jgi:ankyrin repeat protein